MSAKVGDRVEVTAGPCQGKKGYVRGFVPKVEKYDNKPLSNAGAAYVNYDGKDGCDVVPSNLLRIVEPLKESVIIKIPRKELAAMNAVLKRKTRHPEHEDTVAVYTANFGEGWEADIKVCNGDPPFVDAVLFCNGAERVSLAPEGDLDGEYLFSAGSNKFTVIVKRE